MSIESISIQENILLPPSPPNREEEAINNIPIRIRIGLPSNIIPGKFTYIKKKNIRDMLSSAYEAINLLELWDFITEDPGSNGFMFSSDNRLSNIYYKIEELGYMGHSGCSFGFTMREMQSVAKKGEEKYRLEYLKHNS
jgi:hypothetical protein